MYLFLKIILTVSNYNNFYIDSITFRNAIPLNMGLLFKNDYSKLNIFICIIKWILKIYRKDSYLSSTRRLYPSSQIIYNSFKVSSTTSTVTFSYQPANYLINSVGASFSKSYGVCTRKILFHIYVKIKFISTYFKNAITISHTTFASPPVSGAFSLNWNGSSIQSIMIKFLNCNYYLL